jgi:hypothetical protein
MNFSISRAFYMPPSIGRANIDLVSINGRGYPDAKFLSRLLFPLPPMAVKQGQMRPKKLLQTRTDEAKESVTNKDR